MPNYCVNKNAQPQSGDHEVHDVDIERPCLPAASNRIPLGWHANCHGAVAEAKRRYPQQSASIDGCYHCANDCHTK